MWKTSGLKMHIPEDALPPEVKEMPVTVKAVASCEHTPPADAEQVSGVYSIATSQAFTKPVTLEIEHNCLLESPGDKDSLFFGKSSGGLPYKFQPMEGGTFKQKTGKIKVKSPSIVAAFKRTSQKSFHNTGYTASLYYSETTTACNWNVYFVITKDLEIIKQVCY